MGKHFWYDVWKRQTCPGPLLVLQPWVERLMSIRLISFICKTQAVVSPSADRSEKKTAIHVEPLAQCPNWQNVKK